MSLKVRITEDARRETGGYAIVTAQGLPKGLSEISYGLRRRGYPDACNLGTAGWQGPETWLKPLEAWYQGDEIKFVIAPEVTDHLEVSTYVLVIHAPELPDAPRVPLSWPRRLEPESPQPPTVESIIGTPIGGMSIADNIPSDGGRETGSPGSNGEPVTAASGVIGSGGDGDAGKREDEAPQGNGSETGSGSKRSGADEVAGPGIGSTKPDRRFPTWGWGLAALFLISLAVAAYTGWHPQPPNPTPVNRQPVAMNDRATVPAGQTLTVDVLDNDYDADHGDVLRLDSITLPPQHGRAEVANERKVRYVPTPGFSGTDHFDYRIHDQGRLTAEAQVTVQVEPPPERPPVAENDRATVPAGQTLTVDVLANDHDPDPDDVLHLDGVTRQPQHGRADVVGEKARYVPESGFSGADDRFNYRVRDRGGLTAEAEVAVDVLPPPPPPPIAAAKPVVPIHPASTRGSDLVQQAGECLQQGDHNCAVEHCNEAAALDVEMASLCGRLFDPHYPDSRGDDPRQTFDYYNRARDMGKDMTKELKVLLEWLRKHGGDESLKTRIRQVLGSR